MSLQGYNCEIDFLQSFMFLHTANNTERCCLSLQIYIIYIDLKQYKTRQIHIKPKKLIHTGMLVYNVTLLVGLFQ